MIRAIRGVTAATAVILLLTAGTAAAQKAGGILRVYSAESPPGLTSRRRRGARGRSWGSTTT
jgi:hypothetical protein